VTEDEDKTMTTTSMLLLFLEPMIMIIKVHAYLVW
jgi:hypothetical protein